MKYVRSTIALLYIFLLLPIPKADAVSNGVVIAQLQTASSASASSEIVLLLNTANEDIDVTNWCLKYYSASDNPGFQSCLTPPNESTRLMLPSGGTVSFVTNSFLLERAGFTADMVMSGGMANPGGHVRIVDEQGAIIDTLGWGTAVHPETAAAKIPNSGELLTRNLSQTVTDSDNNQADFMSGSLLDPIAQSLYEEEVLIDVCPNIDDLQTDMPEGMLADNNGDCFTDECSNIEGLQKELPSQYVKSGEDCILLPLEKATLFITELLPNAPGADSGQEFIELHNPNDRPIDLRGYAITVGPTYTKNFTFDSGQLAENEYRIFSDSETGIILSNSNGQKLRLISPAGDVVSESELYSNAQDDESWALIDDSWIWTNQLTPNAANKPYLAPVVNEEVGVTTVYAPCPAGKFRNPETNRCKAIETTAQALTACDEGEERNPETNRCRKINSSLSSLTPCKPGQTRNLDTNRCRSTSSSSLLTPCKPWQVRNPETNRCRSAVSSNSLKPCDEGEERNPETNRCRKISAVLASGKTANSVSDIAADSSNHFNWPVVAAVTSITGGYMLYEWRRELTQWLRFRKST